MNIVIDLGVTDSCVAIMEGGDANRSAASTDSEEVVDAEYEEVK